MITVGHYPRIKALAIRAPEVVLLLLLCYFLVFSYVFYLLQYSTTSGAHSWLCYRPWVIHPRLLKCSPSGYKLASTFSRYNSLVGYYRTYYANIWIFHSSLFVLHLNTHYVAIVPADLQSAGIEYKKRSSAQLIS